MQIVTWHNERDSATVNVEGKPSMFTPTPRVSLGINRYEGEHPAQIRAQISILLSGMPGASLNAFVHLDAAAARLFAGAILRLFPEPDITPCVICDASGHDIDGHRDAQDGRDA